MTPTQIPLPVSRPPTLVRRGLLPAVLVFLGLLGLTIDLPVARYCREDSYPRLVADVLHSAEPFGHAAGVAFAIVTVAVLDPARRRWAPAVLSLAAIAGGISANIVKLSVARTRPRNLDLAVADVSQTFQGLLTFGAGGSASQSFPSAHTAVAFAFAVALSSVYPRGRWWFFTLAVLVGLHRIESSAHYPSDVLFGAALGLIVGQVVVGWTTPMRRTESERLDEASSLRAA